MYRLIVLSMIYFFCLLDLNAQEGKVLISEGFSQGTLPPLWAASSGLSISIAGQVTTDVESRNLKGIYGIGLNTQGQFLQLPELSSCGKLHFSYKGTSFPSSLGFKIQKLVSGASSWIDVAVVSKPISGFQSNGTVEVQEKQRVRLRFILHDRTANTLYLDNIIATDLIDPNELLIQTMTDEVDFGNCHNDSTLFLAFKSLPDSIDQINFSVIGTGFEAPISINPQEGLEVPIRFVGDQYRLYDAFLEIRVADKKRSLPLRARRVSGTRLTFLTDLIYGEEQPNWIVKAISNGTYFLLSSTDSLSIPKLDLSNCLALQILVSARTYNGMNQQYLSIEALDQNGVWIQLGQIAPTSSTLSTYDYFVVLKQTYRSLRFIAKNVVGSFRLGVESITVNGAFGNALSLKESLLFPLKVVVDKGSWIHIYSDSNIDQLSIINIQGQVVLNESIRTNYYRTRLPKGIYILKCDNRFVKVAI